MQLWQTSSTLRNFLFFFPIRIFSRGLFLLLTIRLMKIWSYWDRLRIRIICRWLRREWVRWTETSRQGQWWTPCPRSLLIWTNGRLRGTVLCFYFYYVRYQFLLLWMILIRNQVLGAYLYQKLCDHMFSLHKSASKKNSSN